MNIFKKRDFYYIAIIILITSINISTLTNAATYHALYKFFELFLVQSSFENSMLKKYNTIQQQNADLTISVNTGKNTLKKTIESNNELKVKLGVLLLEKKNLHQQLGSKNFHIIDIIMRHNKAENHLIDIQQQTGDIAQEMSNRVLATMSARASTLPGRVLPVFGTISVAGMAIYETRESCATMQSLREISRLIHSNNKINEVSFICKQFE